METIRRFQIKIRVSFDDILKSNDLIVLKIVLQLY